MIKKGNNIRFGDTIFVVENFDNDSYFFRLFKKKYGTTPLKYRKSKS